MERNSCKAYALAFAVVLIVSGCQKNLIDNSPASAQQQNGSAISTKQLKDFVQIDLKGSNSKHTAIWIYTDLINGWVLDFSPSGTVRVAVEGRGRSNVYTLDGDIAATPINVPAASTSDGASHPTGHVVNGSADFKLSNGN